MSLTESILTPLQIKIWFERPDIFFEDVFGDKPYPYQAKFMRMWTNYKDHKRVIAVAAGGTGKTKLLAGTALFFTCVIAKIEKTPKSVIILAGSLNQAKNVYGFIREAATINPIIRSMIDDYRQSDSVFYDGSSIKALSSSLKAIQGQHGDVVIVDEAALVEDFQLDDCYRIIGAHDGVMVWSGTPTVYSSKYVKLFEETERDIKAGKETLWEIFTWAARDCPRLVDQMEEVKSQIPEDMWQIFWEGKPYPLTGTLVPRDAMVAAVRGITAFKYNPEWYTIIGVDWGYCLSSDTEVLTNRGWLEYTELKPNDLIYTLNPETMIGEYQLYTNLRSRPYNGTLHGIKSRNIDILSKWNHNLLVYDRNMENPHLHDVGEGTTHDIIPRYAPLKGDSPEYFILPSVTSKRTDLDFTEKKLPIVPFLRVLGWYLTEGSKYSKGIQITQEQEYYRDIIFNDIKELGYHCFPANHHIKISSVQLRSYFARFGLARDKFIPQEIKNLDSSLLVHLIDRMMKGDGDKVGNRFNTFSKQLAEDFAEIVDKSGIGYAIIRDRGLKGYRVSILTRHSIPNPHHYYETKYVGHTWCLNTPNETLYVRRNGKPTFIHNGDPTGITVWQTDGEHYVCLEAIMFRQTDFDIIHDRIEVYAKDYNVFRIFVDGSDKGENLRLRKRGLPVFEVHFNKEKHLMQARLRDLFIKNRVKIPDIRTDNFQDLIYQLRTYTWTKASGEDLVDSTMLALKEVFPSKATEMYIASGRARRRRRLPR